MRLVNVPMRRILALPFSTPLSKRLMLLHLTGRRSGRSYRQPVSYVKDGDSLLTPGGGNWKLNLDPGRPERIPHRALAPRHPDGVTAPASRRLKSLERRHEIRRTVPARIASPRLNDRL
jgi:hypothetical protein